MKKLFIYYLKGRDALENGGSFISDKLKVSKTSYGLGIFAQTEIEEDEILLQIPQKILIGLNYILQDKEFIGSVEARAQFLRIFWIVTKQSMTF